MAMWLRVDRIEKFDGVCSSYLQQASYFTRIAMYAASLICAPTVSAAFTHGLMPNSCTRHQTTDLAVHQQTECLDAGYHPVNRIITIS